MNTIKAQLEQKLLADERDTIAMRIRNTKAYRKSKTGTAFDLIKRGSALVAVYNDIRVFGTSAVVQDAPLFIPDAQLVNSAKDIGKMKSIFDKTIIMGKTYPSHPVLYWLGGWVSVIGGLMEVFTFGLYRCDFAAKYYGWLLEKRCSIRDK